MKNYFSYSLCAVLLNLMSVASKIIIILLIILMGGNGLFIWYAYQKSQVWEGDSLLVERDKVTLTNANAYLTKENKQLRSDVDALKALLGIEQLSGDACAKENACRFRGAEDEFRCDGEGRYDLSGDFLCQCDVSCEVEIK